MTAIAPTTPLFVETAALEAVMVDIYRNIHKGIRNELFAVTLAAGQRRPPRRRGRSARSPAAGATWSSCSSPTPSTRRTSCSR